jgi:hypothetical protein
MIVRRWDNDIAWSKVYKTLETELKKHLWIQTNEDTMPTILLKL